MQIKLNHIAKCDKNFPLFRDLLLQASRNPYPSATSGPRGAGSLGLAGCDESEETVSSADHFYPV